MCGIVGYIGYRDTVPVLLNGLRRLEYRGYDSAGIAVWNEQQIDVRKAQGRLANLESLIEVSPVEATIGIGHTRWATHGKPSHINSHPHTDVHRTFSIVHNGIIENYLQLKDELTAKGYVFVSETDTEVISHLLADCYTESVFDAVQKATKRMRGAFALAVLSIYEPDRLYAVRYASPLIVGIGVGEQFIASDIPAILEYTRDVIILNDGEVAILTRDGVEVRTFEGQAVDCNLLKVDWDVSTAEKGGYEHFMLKEIHEQPSALRKTLTGRIETDYHRIKLDDLGMKVNDVKNIERIHIVACGTAFHAGLIGKTVLERLLRVPVQTEIASEYRYANPIITANTLVIVVSQSGETADTLAALREAKRQGANVLAITNVVGSSVAREADHVFLTWAGPEIAVASTKAYTTQLLGFYLISLYFAQLRGALSSIQIGDYIAALQQIPDQVEHILESFESFISYAKQLNEKNNLFFIGRGTDYGVCLEGSLKLKEISYIHSEAYAAGELKHGTLALIEEGTPVVALLTQDDLFEKTLSNIKEVKARGANVLAIANADHASLRDASDAQFFIPQTNALFHAITAVIPMQLIAYYAAWLKGHDVDKPRNLAKSVTVE